MKNIKNTTALICAVLSSSCAGTDSSVSRGFPQATISNGKIEAVLAVDTGRPDNFYRGQRFDWSGVIYSLRFDGHEYFGEWFSNFDPYFHDTICGPVEEFTQIGYENAPVGGEFLKIGVGVLRKKADTEYTFRVPYEIVDGGKWTCKIGAKSVEYNQKLDSKIACYDYTKVVELVDGAPVMKIRHTLKNTGKTPIETLVYCHNFFMLDGEKTSPAISLKFAYEPRDPELVRDPDGLSVLKGDTLKFTRQSVPADNILYRGLKGLNKVENYDFVLSNSKTGATVRIKSDSPLVKATFWACHTTYCIEPFTKISIPVGGEYSWVNTYEFSSTK